MPERVIETTSLFAPALVSRVPSDPSIGVATSQVSFWRSLGGAVGTAVLGSILANRLPAGVPLRLALAGTLPDLFLMAAGVAAVALVATLFLREVPFARAAVVAEDHVREAA